MPFTVHDVSRRLPFGPVLANDELRRLLAAYGLSTTAEWSLWVALLVYSYQHVGARGAGLVSIGVLVPAIVATPVASSCADGLRPNGVLVRVYFAMAGSLTVAAGAAFVSGPFLVVVVSVAVAITSIAFVRPTFAVVVPGIVTTPGELIVANLATSYCDSASTLIGPLTAAAFLAIGGPALALAGCAMSTAIATCCTAPLVSLDPPRAARHAVTCPSTSRPGLASAVRALASGGGTAQLLVVIGAHYLVVGALDLIVVVLAADELGLHRAGPGLLTATIGVGAVLGSIGSTRLLGRARLAPVAATSLALMAVALTVLGGVTTVAVALVALPAIGLGRSTLEVTGRMLLQRAAPQDALASTFAVLEVVSLIGCALGSIIAQSLIALSGVRSALVGLGIVLAVLLASTTRRLQRIDATADAPVVAIRLLRKIPLFAALPGPALEVVARASMELDVAAGSAIVNEGERGDCYYAIASGSVEVSSAGQQLRTMGRGEGFGEIALLADVARTATVVALTPSHLLAIDRRAFLTAVTGHDTSRRAAWGVVGRYDTGLTRRGGS